MEYSSFENNKLNDISSYWASTERGEYYAFNINLYLGTIYYQVKNAINDIRLFLRIKK